MQSKLLITVKSHYVITIITIAIIIDVLIIIISYVVMLERKREDPAHGAFPDLI